MRKNEFDYLLQVMLGSQREVSDLNFTVDKPLQVESNGELVPVSIDPPFDRLTAFQTEMLALILMQGNRRLMETLIRTGSCDSSYALSDQARFRVNIFSQRGQYQKQCCQHALHTRTSRTAPLFDLISKGASGTGL